MKLIIFLTILIILFGLLENYLNYRNLKKIPIRILVNGTRGKTTVTRLIATTFQSYGIETIARTTGSQALILEKDGNITSFKRKRGSRITELIPFVKYCSKNNVKCIVIECNALREENQKIISEKIIKPTHIIITNNYVDHIAEIGNSIEKTTYTLSQCVIEGSKLFVNEEFNLSYIPKNIEVTKSSKKENLCNYNDYVKQFPENLFLTIAFIKEFNIPLSFLEKASNKLKKDIGMHRKFTCKKGSLFLPLFSVNDITSFNSIIIRTNLSNFDSINFIFNNRKDREYRIKEFSSYLSNFNFPYNLYIIGENCKKASRIFSKKSPNTKIISEIKELSYIMNESNDKTIYIGIGNIKNQGIELINTFLKDSN